MSKLVICEKPSVAKSIASALGGSALKELFFKMILVIRPSTINENSRFL